MDTSDTTHRPHPHSIMGKRMTALERFHYEQTKRSQQEAMSNEQDADYFYKLAHDPMLRREAGEETPTGLQTELLGHIMLREALADDVAREASTAASEELQEKYQEQVRDVEALKREMI